MIEYVFLILFLVLAVMFFSYFSLMIYSSRRPNKRSTIVTSKILFPSVSILIATFNEEKVIARKLKNTLELDYPREKFEIVIVDSGSTDDTRKIINDFQSKEKNTQIRLLTQDERLGKAAALNYALKSCESDIFVLTDADVVVNKFAVVNAITNFNDEKIGAVSGIEVMDNPDESSTTKIEQSYRSFYNTLRLGESYLDSVMMCESEFTAYRRALIGTIPENSICDDMELTIQVRRKDFRAVYDPRVTFYEYSPSAYISRIKHKIRRGQGNQQTLLRYTKMLFSRSCGTFSSVIMPFEYFLNIIAPMITISCVATFIATIFSTYSLFWAIIPVVIVAIMGSVVLFVLKFASPATEVTLVKSNGPTINLQTFGSIFDFIGMQFLLFASLLLLIVRGPQYKWEKIEGTRRS